MRDMTRNIPSTPTDHDGFVLGFVYGTLRPGFGNHAYFEDAIMEDMGEGTVKGRLYAAGIPFLDTNANGLVRGNLFAYDPDNPRFIGMACMEMDAGYEWRIVTVTLDDGTEVEAGVWHYDRANDYAKLIPTGDYADYVASERGRWF